MITVVTPFKRIENLELLAKTLEGKCNWILLIDDESLKDKFPDWVSVILYPKLTYPKGHCVSNYLFNAFIEEHLDDETQYMILCDDDSVEEDFFDKIPNEDVVITSMKRGQRVPSQGVGYGYGDLTASPDNIAIGKVAGEQCILKGKVLKNYQYGLSAIGDGEMIMKVVKDHIAVYVPNAYVLFNYFEDGRYDSFRRKPIVLFIGDFYCAGNPAMGKSEWEGNLWASLESTGLVDVARFHMDKYYYHTGKRGDEALLERVKEIKPDYIVLIMYKIFGTDPTVMNHITFLEISCESKIIMIWGDLEALEQRELAKFCETECHKMIGTANKSVVEEMGYKYLHVPKDPNVFNNPDVYPEFFINTGDKIDPSVLKPGSIIKCDTGDLKYLGHVRDIDVVFSGSFGLGREERREVLQHLLDNGIRLVVGGSEGGEHFSTEEYADRYKRAKIAISFSQARGMNVVNARPFEVMNCGSMLIEQESPELAKLYEEGVDYVSWKDKDDLLSKICYYIDNDKERETIANNGYKKTQERYTASSFWKEALSL